MIMVDPKMLELSIYEGIPHLLLPVVTDPKKANLALRWAVEEMERRYELLAQAGVRDIAGYNKKVEKQLADGPPKLESKKIARSTSPTRAAAEQRGRVLGRPRTRCEAAGGVVADEVAEEIAADAAPQQKSAEAQPARRRRASCRTSSSIIDEFADLMMVARRRRSRPGSRASRRRRAPPAST